MNDDSVVKKPLQWQLDRQSFYNEFIERFNMDEIRKLCYELDIKYEELDGSTLSSKTIELFNYFERDERLDDLFKACQKVRSNTDWWKFLQPTALKKPGEHPDSKVEDKANYNWSGLIAVGLIAFFLGSYYQMTKLEPPIITPHLIYSFEDNIIPNWEFDTDLGTPEIANDTALIGNQSLVFRPNITARESSNEGGGSAQFFFNIPKNVREELVIFRVYVPDGSPENLSAQIMIRSEEGELDWGSYQELKANEWVTLVRSLSDIPPDFIPGKVGLQFLLEDPDNPNTTYCLNEGPPTKGYEDEPCIENFSIYIDAVELLPYNQETVVDAFKALKAVNYYAFDEERKPDNLTILNQQLESVNPSFSFDNDDIVALRLDVNLPATEDNLPTPENSAGVKLATNDEPIEAVFSYVLVPEDPGGSLSLTFIGTTSGGQEISSIFPLTAGDWTPIFWPTRNNDFDASPDTPGLENITVYITSDEAYQGSIFFDYLATYSFFPED